ncbi:MAG: class I SAM-dependent methyltransferase [Actinomycetota bacterium]|nr:class I SAM-dependent methyltransferase [Actinomycetota bacterium]
MNGKIYRDYDDFAWFYNRYWGETSCGPQALDLLDRLILSRLPEGARILDVCCGTGQLDQALTRRGFGVTGIDASARQLDYARLNAPLADFIHTDARSFSMPAVFDGSISIFDSLNHILTIEELGETFRNVRDALVPGGLFLFDLNTEEGLRTRWSGTSNSRLEEDNAFIMNFSYDHENKKARADIIMFRLMDGVWQRSDVSLWQKAYSDKEITSALTRSGFVEVTLSDAARDLGAGMGAGRVFILARASR